MAIDIPTRRPMRPQADIERIYRLLDARRFGAAGIGGPLPPLSEFLTTNVAADALAWVLHQESGVAFALHLSQTIAEADKAAAGGLLEEAALGGVDLIALERRRQVQVEGWTAAHDDQHDAGQMAVAAACYAAAGNDEVVVSAFAGFGGERAVFEDAWPWDEKWDKREQHTNLRRLVIAGALLAAEIDRLLRAGAPLADATPGG